MGGVIITFTVLGRLKSYSNLDISIDYHCIIIFQIFSSLIVVKFFMFLQYNCTVGYLKRI